MKSKILLFISIFILIADARSQWIPIDSARSQDPVTGVALFLNQSVTTSGVVSTRREFGLLLVYFQDRTDGLVAFDTAFNSGVKRGDSVLVTGVVTQFAGLTELNPVTSFTVLDTGRVVNPTVLTCAQVKASGEQYEGMLIKIRNITAVHDFNGAPITTWTVGGSGTNFRILDGNDSCDIRIYATSNIANQPVAALPFDVVAECSQFKSASPFIGGYQILPRRLDDFLVPTAVSPVLNTVADKYSLDQNYPNPFNPTTVIGYQLPVNGDVLIKVYDVLGNEVKTLVKQKQNAGNYRADFDGSNLSSGIYFYSLSVNGNPVNTRSMILLK